MKQSLRRYLKRKLLKLLPKLKLRLLQTQKKLLLKKLLRLLLKLDCLHHTCSKRNWRMCPEGCILFFYALPARFFSGKTEAGRSLF